jgi:outer membrane protein TolC
MKLFVKNKLIKFFGILILGLNASCLNALTWDECVDIAKQNNPQVISAKEKINQAISQKKINASSLFPQLSASFKDQESKIMEDNQDVINSYSYGLTGSMLLFDGFQTIYKIKASSMDLQKAEYDYQNISSQVRYDLRVAFIQLKYAKELVSLTQAIAERRKQNEGIVALRYKVGREHRGSLKTAQADLDASESEVRQALRQVDLARAKLSEVLGKEISNDIEVNYDEDLKDMDNEQIDFSKLMQDHPQVKSYNFQMKSTKYSLSSAKANYFPEIFANASVGGSSTDNSSPQNSWNAGINVTLPIFKGRQTRETIKQLKSKLKQSESDLADTENSVLYNLKDKWNNLKNSIEDSVVQEKYLDAALERAKISQAEYSTGLITFDDWTIIENNLVNAKKSLLNAQTNAYIAQAEWVQGYGGTLDEK